jgi:hypothetical protein
MGATKPRKQWVSPHVVISNTGTVYWKLSLDKNFAKPSYLCIAETFEIAHILPYPLNFHLVKTSMYTVIKFPGGSIYI